MIASKTLAIQTALAGDWEGAIKINEELLAENSNDIDTLNRLAFAWSSMGNIKKAKAIYQQVLDIDEHNPIASRNIKRLNGSDGKQFTSVAPLSFSNLFIEEPGKTKVVELINIADKKTLTMLRSGEKIDMQIKRMKIFVMSQQKHFIGMLPDDLGKRLIKLIEAGNQYDTFIKSSQENKVIIFIRETKRVLKFKNQPSFITLEKTRFTFKTIHDEDHESADNAIESD